ncbi:hypothetical protein NDA15_006049 [Ustilago hordei]|nr:hypothetical protein NDA15_006049 [Ustilago hordei]
MLAARRSFVKIWLSNAAVAFEEKKIDFRTRSAHLEGFFRLPYYDDLTRELILNVSLLPNAFVHDVLDTSQDPAVVRPSLSLLQGHITVHNSFFATSAEPIHSNEDKAEEDPEPKLPVRDWGKYYSKVLPILQSSGFGKTRMCVQLSTVSPGMLICLRHKTRAGDKQHRESFPPQDSHVSDAMEEDSIASSSADLESESRSPNSAFAATGTMDETSALWRWADRAWLNFKHIVRLEDQVNAQKVLNTEELVQLWFRQAAAQDISNQPGWDLLIPVYESNTSEAPGDDEMFDKAKLSYIAIQVKNCIKRPSKAVRNGHHDQQQGHMYSQRQHPQPKTDTPLTQADQRARQLLRHHLYIAGQDGGTFPQLNWLLSPAKEQVALLFGCTVSVETVEFDQMQARYVRDQKSQSEQDTWDEAQVRIHGALVISGCLSAASLDPNVID